MKLNFSMVEQFGELSRLLALRAYMGEYRPRERSPETELIEQAWRNESEYLYSPAVPVRAEALPPKWRYRRAG